MNYRHAFHAGNFADCVKHALLLHLLHALSQKAAPFFVLDTHAGSGRYDLTSGPAARTGEWRNGISRLLADTPEPLRPYTEQVQRLGLYPGSPLLIRAALRPQDRLACCERHPGEAAALRRLFTRDHQVGVHHRDGWEAIGGLLPPKEKRGLVLIDPPYEQPNELDTVAEALRTASKRFPAGILAAWYPIKHRAPIRAFHAAIRESGMRDVVAVELWLREPVDAARLNGCGLLIANPPYPFAEAAAPILAALLERLGDREPGEGTALIRLADE